MNVRPYRNTDKKNFTKICLITAGQDNPETEEAKFITELYNNYYTENEPSNCFALTDEDDNAVGYIICSDDFSFYRKKFNGTLNRIKQTGFGHYLLAIGEVIGHGLYKKSYPAHLHIDILPEHQHCGGGSLLMNKLKEHLKANGINSVHLMVNAQNKNAVKFYKKNGFRIHTDLKKLYVMTCDF